MSVSFAVTVPLAAGDLTTAALNYGLFEFCLAIYARYWA